MIDGKKLIKRFEHIPSLSKIIHNLVRIVEEQPKVGEWIPVSKRLPNEEEFKKDDGRFILDNGNSRYQGFFDIDDGCFKFPVRMSGLSYQLVEDKDVIAWQPLPNPYCSEK